MGDGTLSVRLVDVEDVGCATIRAKLPIHRQVEVPDGTVMTEDLTQVVLSNIFGELFNDNLCASEVRAYAPLRGGRGEAAGARFGARATPVSAFTSIPAIAPRSGR